MLRANQLSHLNLRHVIFAADTAFLTGVVGHQHLQSLDLTGSVLHEHEAAELGAAVAKNTSLQVLSLQEIRFAVDYETHQAVFRQTVLALAKHSTVIH
jgi:hypothetical protein